ncbi:chalcone isomerase family protein [Aliikangiella sp. IMCC44653]
MNRSIFTFWCFIFITFALVGNKTLAAEKLQDLPLASLAIHEKHQVPIFYAAVYANQVTDNATIFDEYTPIRMESRLLVESYSSRQMHQMWVGAILINTPRTELKELADPFLIFSQLIKVDLVKGDHLVFDYNADQGTKIILNGTLLGQVSDTRFQKALTAAWFGNRPPSKPFGQSIRKAPNSKAIAAFEAIQPSSQRIAQVASRFAKSNSSQAVAEETAAEPAEITKVAKVEPQQNTQPAPKKQPNPKTLEVKKPVQVQPKKSDTKPTKKVAEKPKAVSKTTQQAPPKQVPTKQVQPKKAPVKKATPKPKATKPKVAKVEKPKQESNDILDSMIATLKQDYVDEVTDYIESKARPKPPRSIRKLSKDIPQLKVTIIRNGSNAKVTAAEVISGEFLDAMKAELKESVLELRSLPAFPDSIPDSQLELLVTLDLSKCKRSTSAWICL